MVQILVQIDKLPMLEDLPSSGILRNIISLTANKLKIVPVMSLSSLILEINLSELII